MSSGVESSLLDQAQKAGNPDSAMEAYLSSALKNLHTALPGIISAVDLSTQTATVQLAIQRVFTERGAVALPPCLDVPLHYPSGGNFVLTFPVQEGDECLCVFSERCIDFWFVSGGVQLPAEYRLHDLSDAFAFVGVRSLPNKLSDVQADGAELRTLDRSTYIRVTEGNIFIKGNIIHEGNTTQTGDTTSTGTVTAPLVVGTTNVTFGGISGKDHVHHENDVGGNTDGPTS